MIKISSFSCDVIMQSIKKIIDSPVEGFKHYIETGMEYSDIIAAYFDIYPLDEYMKLYKESGMKPGSLITSYNITARDKEERDKNINAVKDLLDRIPEYNIPDIMLSAMTESTNTRDDVLEQREFLVEGFGVLTDYAKKNGVSIGFENRNSSARPDSTIEDIKYILDNVPDLGFVYDTANLYIADQDPFEMYNAFRDRITHFHFKDWIDDPNGSIQKNGVACLSGCAVGKGILPLRELAKLIKKDNFDSRASIEINKYSGIVGIEEIDDSIKFLKELFS